MKKQYSFADLEMNSVRKPTRVSEKLDKINALVDWGKASKIVSKADKTGKKGGRPHKSLLTKTKMLFLQNLYGLSDPELEDQVGDRLSFREFCGIGADEGAPDFTTIWRFKERLIGEGVLEGLFALVLDELREKGVELKGGTIVDATIIESANRPLSKERREEKRESRQVDTDARSTKKRGKWHFGHKGHIGVDAESKLIKKASFTDAAAHDSTEIDFLTAGEDKAVFGDKAYASMDRKRELRRRGIYCGILDKAAKNRPLRGSQKKRNKRKSRIRNRVEHPFAYIKNRLGHKAAVARNGERNGFRFFFCCLLYNIFRGSCLLSRKPVES